jgi:hypothetical protein
VIGAIIVATIPGIVFWNFEGKLHAYALICVGVTFNVAIHAGAYFFANTKAEAVSIWIEFLVPSVCNSEVGREQFFLVFSRYSNALVPDFKNEHLADNVNLN